MRTRQYLRCIATITLLLAVLLLSACSSQLSEKEIKRQIAAADSCSTDNDCVLLPGKCPFGCYAAVNVRESLHIGMRLEEYQSSCAYSCIQCTAAQCVSNHCVPVCDVPSNATLNETQ